MTTSPRSLNAFHLERGGPLYRLMALAGLLNPDCFKVWRAIIFLLIITWMPLLLLSLAQGVFIGDTVRVPFLYAISAHIRYLLAVPLFILAEPFIGSRLSMAAAHFIHSDFLKEEVLPQFEQAIDRAKKARDSNWPELTLLILALAAMMLKPQLELPRSITTWQLHAAEGLTELTLAGWWNALVSSTVFRFLIFRWLWRLLIWTMFLRRVSRLSLRLYPTHPDGAGGLLFLGAEQLSWCILVFAGGCVLSANFAQAIFFAGVSPVSLIPVILLFILIGLVIVFGPLFMFSPMLFRVKFNQMHAYLLMSTEYNRLFFKRWMMDQAYEDELILGTEDIQSLSSLDSVIGMIRNMRLYPFSLDMLYFPILSAVLPMLPLIAFEVSLDEIITKFLNNIL